MNRFITILGLAVIALLSPLVGKAQSVSPLHRSPFKIDKLSTRQDTTHTWVYGEITNNAKKEASTVYILVRWFDKSRRVVAHYTTIVTDLAPGATLPFRAFAKKNPDIIRYDVTVDRVRFAHIKTSQEQPLESCRCSNQLRQYSSSGKLPLELVEVYAIGEFGQAYRIRIGTSFCATTLRRVLEVPS